jgi:hypothetical protein
MWDDRRDEQVSRTSERFSGPEPDLATALDTLREGFLLLPEHDPVTGAQEFLTRMESMDSNIVASPHLLDHARTPTSDAERSAVLRAIDDLLAMPDRVQAQAPLRVVGRSRAQRDSNPRPSD